MRDGGETHERWARLRFSVVGPLLASPPARGELWAEIRRLAAKAWNHPTTGAPVRFSFATLERWYYAARNARDPIGALARQVRRDAGSQPSLSPALRELLRVQYEAHPSWSIQLHNDNLAVLAAADPALGRMPSYATIFRYMKGHGLLRRRRTPESATPGEARAAARLEEREVRSFEAEYVHGLWHLDFHVGSRKVLLAASGAWVRPVLLAVLDDRSRLCGHAQWYLAETAENLVHGLVQAIQKRAVPRALLTDNGSAMIAAETEHGLRDLGVLHETTLPHSPYQNGKQEVFWAQVEGRLVSMLEGCADLRLELLNEATQAWVELEYNRAVHSELGCAPLDRFLAGPEVGRPSPSSQELRRAFRVDTMRTQRHSDGTLVVEGRRFEVPSRYRQLTRVRVRYARWDLSTVDLVDVRTRVVLATLHPLDKEKNADGRRRRLDPAPSSSVAPAPSGLAPLLRKLMADYAATGLPPAYVPKDETPAPARPPALPPAPAPTDTAEDDR